MAGSNINSNNHKNCSDRIINLENEIININKK